MTNHTKQHTTHHAPAAATTGADLPGDRQRRQSATLTPQAFRAAPDLNAIAAQIRQAQEQPAGKATEPGRELVVDDRGQVNFSDAADKSRPLTVLSQETFAALLRRSAPTATPLPNPTAPQPRGPIPCAGGWPSAAETRSRHEAAVVAQSFPPGTRAASDGQFNGWVYEITNEFDDLYRFFAYFDPPASLYRVALLHPRLGGDLNAHDAHLFPDGRICLNDEAGCRDLASAFARSALWCRGASMVRRGHGFQFNSGQAR